MQMLNTTRIPKINYIIVLKNGTWNGFARAKDAKEEKNQFIKYGEFAGFYTWTRKNGIPGYYKQD